MSEYDSEKAREETKKKLEALMKEFNDADKANWLHCGSMETLKTAHSVV